MKLRVSLFTLVSVVLVLFAAAPAFPATVVVGTCLPNKVSFDSLTDAVQGVPAGSTILVCPQIYTEQVVIDKSLTIKGQTSGNSAYPVLMPPVGGLLFNASSLNVSSFYASGTAIAAQIVIQAGADVTITDLALDATGYNLPTCSALVVGIFVEDASAELDRVAVKNQLETGTFPCSATGSGAGVLIQNDSANPTTIKINTGTFINASQAFEADGASTTSTITNSSFIGNPASNANAISILSGNSTIKNNTISDYSYPLAAGNIGVAAYGVYLTCVPGGTVQGNTISSTQVGVYLNNPTCPTTSVSVINNDVANATFVGIEVDEINGLIQGNDIYSSLTAIRLSESASGNTIYNNVINDVCAAIGYNPLAGVNSVLTNTISNAMNLSVTNTTALCP